MLRFEEAIARALACGASPTAARATAWRGRAAAYAGQSALARGLLGPETTDPEALWFLGELAAAEEGWEEAAALAGAAVASLGARGYRSADALDFRSGFESLEGRALGFSRGRGYLEDQAAAFAAFARAMARKEPAGIGEIVAFTREERIAQSHPHAHLYHFYCFKVLEAAGGGSLDASTMLSKAFKALQVRSSRLDDSAMKDSFLERSRWNRALMDAARARKML